LILSVRPLIGTSVKVVGVIRLADVASVEVSTDCASSEAHASSQS
jgi:hypothetical protein